VISEAARKRAYDAARPSRSAIYGHRWRKLRAAYLASHPACECGCGYPANVVDHRTPHNGDPALIYAWDNLQAVHAWKTSPDFKRQMARVQQHIDTFAPTELEVVATVPADVRALHEATTA
jgi:5-methylcytosine-specific restriction endonuclease McrA